MDPLYGGSASLGAPVAGLTRSEEDLLDLAENRRRSPREMRRTDARLLALYALGTLLLLKALVLVF